MRPKEVAKPSVRTKDVAVQRRKASLSDALKKEKGRSRNACDRCKQKKVKCDGEGQRVCSICREGDYQCTYAQRAHEEKRQYRKGYVEMVEDTNAYYKNALHEFYRQFEGNDSFKSLHKKYASGGEPTVQEIISALGVPTTGKPHEGGIGAIEAHLEQEGKPLLVRQGDWDRVAGTRQQPSPALTQEDDMDDATDMSSPLAPSSPHLGNFARPWFPASSRESSPAARVPYSRRPASINTGLGQQNYRNYLAQAADGFPTSGSSNGSPLPPSTPDMVDFQNFFSAVPSGSGFGFGSAMAAVEFNSPPSSAEPFGYVAYPSFPTGLGTVRPADLEKADGFTGAQFGVDEPRGGLNLQTSLNGGTAQHDLEAMIKQTGHFGSMRDRSGRYL